jgi:penicillin-insensitive murein DD-endopeptidase
MKSRLIFTFLLLSAAVVSAPAALAQDKGSVDAKPLPPLANPNDPKLGAKELFGRKLLPAAMPTRVIGFYAHGCIAGAEALPINGDTWQVMRLSRNRNWAHPQMVALLERLSAKAHKDAGWPGILVGDMSQPRGGPMITGHASHQVGLDADVWLTPMPNRRLSREEREEMSAVMMVRPDRLDVDPQVFTPGHLAVIRDAAQEPSVQRIFVNAAIKRRCAAKPGVTAAGSPRSGRCTATTITSISASNVPPAAANAKPSPSPRKAKAASLPIWPSGSRIRLSTPSRRKSRRSRGRR